MRISQKVSGAIMRNLQRIIFISGRICDTLGGLVPFVLSKKREKHPWRSIDFSKVAGFSLQLY